VFILCFFLLSGWSAEVLDALRREDSEGKIPSFAVRTLASPNLCEDIDFCCATGAAVCSVATSGKVEVSVFVICRYHWNCGLEFVLKKGITTDGLLVHLNLVRQR
jgi:hypothetical protein